jgi:hypothetical protein
MPELKDPRPAARFIFDATVGALKSGTDVDSCTALVAKADHRFAASFAAAHKVI